MGAARHVAGGRHPVRIAADDPLGRRNDPHDPEDRATPCPPLAQRHPRSAKEQAIYLLQAASQVEHGLLVQYLYAAYSIDPSNDPADLQTSLIDIAIQEMDHLLNVQHMLMALGERPFFGRPNFPLSQDVAPYYPFPFLLEPPSRGSLGKYVAAESPSDKLGPIDLSKLSVDERAGFTGAVADGTASAGRPVNHVGLLYAKLYWMFQENRHADRALGHAAPGTVQGHPPRQTNRLRRRYPAGRPRGDRRRVQGEARTRAPGRNNDPPGRLVDQERGRRAERDQPDRRAGEGTLMTSDSHFVEFLDNYNHFKTTPHALRGPHEPERREPRRPQRHQDRPPGDRPVGQALQPALPDALDRAGTDPLREQGGECRG